MSTSSNRLRVIIIGAGFSGLCLGYHLKKTGLADFTILEKADGIGGTWRENTYPGAACDVMSLSYCFSFAQKTDWSRKWAEQAEILEYMEACADEFGLREHLRCGCEVTGAEWDEQRSIWKVSTKDGELYEAEFLVSGVGQLHRPSVPDIPGLDAFEGIQFHSARWRHDVDLSGKTVAVIGNAASAIQFIPPVAEVAKKVVVFQRSANWMMRRRDRTYTDAEKERFAKHPAFTRLCRWLTWAGYESQFPVFAGNRLMSRMYQRMAERYLDETIADESLKRALTPDYPIGAKRILISDDYYDAIARDHVHVITDGVSRVTEHSVMTAGGKEYEADVLILATGFKTVEFLVPMEIKGSGGDELSERWRDGAEAYLGISVAGFPNFFMMYGPNTNLGHNSIIFMIECQTAYIVNCLKQALDGDFKAIDLLPDVQERYNDALQKKLGSRVWASVGKSWYKNAAGRITNNWSGTTTEYWWKTRKPDLSNYRVVTGRDSTPTTDGREPS